MVSKPVVDQVDMVESDKLKSGARRTKYKSAWLSRTAEIIRYNLLQYDTIQCSVNHL